MSTLHQFSGPDAALNVLAQLMTCCNGAAIYGPSRCTCWEPVWPDSIEIPMLDGTTVVVSPEQADCEPGQPVSVRRTPCDDCAYRPDSPERGGSSDVSGDQEMLDRIVRDGQPFWCHQGMRAPIAWRHPLGITVAIPPLTGYQPVTTIDPDTSIAVAHKVDGTPADICAGWAARRLHYVATLDDLMSELA